MTPALDPQAFLEQKGVIFASVASFLCIHLLVGLIHASGLCSLCKERHFFISDIKGSSQK